MACPSGPGRTTGAGPAPAGKRRFHAMAKPSASACNLRCTYCYYLSKATLDSGPGSGRMSPEMLETFIRQYIEGHDYEEVVFSWQGGEPTLLGLDFFREVVRLEKKYADGKRIQNDLQTNGTLLDEDWCRFLKANEWLVGISVDGPRELHDRSRVTREGEPTFDRVLRSAGLLRKHGVAFNTLTVVSPANVTRPLPVYRFLTREIGATYIQLIPCVEPKGFEDVAPQRWAPEHLPKLGERASKPGHPESVVTEWSVDPDAYGEFLCKVFDEWFHADLGRVLVNLFETLVVRRLGRRSQLCVFGEFCGKGVAVEHDGSVYSCDHYVYPQYRLGSIHESHLADMVFSQRQMDFGYAKRDTLPKFCQQCQHLRNCRGECPKNRFICTPMGDPGLNYLCRGLRTFFTHARPHVAQIVAQLRQPAPSPSPPAGRPS